MLKPQALFGLMIELIVLLLGLLLALLALSGRLTWNQRQEVWMVLAAALFAMGVRGILRAGQYSTRWLNLTRGASFVLVAVIMFAVLVTPLEKMRFLLAAAGGVLALRGLISAVLVLRTA